MNLKALIEKRNALVEEMQSLKDAVVLEERAFSDDENAKFDDLEKQVRDLDATIEKAQRANSMSLANAPEVKAPEAEMSQEEKDVRAFANYIRGTVSERADENLTYGDNGAVIPTTIANKILKKVYDICPVYAQATHYTMKGNVTVPYYDESDGTITVAYA
ncbi:MAG: phage major capsid protein, partial [Bacteroidales bacterium]|nr:phage major capsid protein [Bacteroidales bacterium]